MQKQRDKFEPWVEKALRPRYPELETPLMAAVDAFDVVQQTGKLIPELLRPIVDAVCSSRRPLYENACEFMRTLSSRWPEANVAILDMSQSNKAHVRFNAILCLGGSSPPDTAKTILRRGLLDKSSRVRRKAADWIGRLRKTELISELTAALATESDSKARATMEFELRLLRDGYILEPEGGGRFRMTVHMDGGGVSSAPVEQDRLSKQGIDAVAAELRSSRPYK